MKWQPISVDIKTLSFVCPCPWAIYIYKIRKKNCLKSDFKKIFLKLATDDQSDKMFLLKSKFHPQGVVSSCPRAIYMHKIIKNCIKSDFKEIFWKLVANDWSDKRFLLIWKFCPQGCLPLTCGYVHLLNHDQMCINSEVEEILFKLAANDHSEILALMGCWPLPKLAPAQV